MTPTPENQNEALNTDASLNDTQPQEQLSTIFSAPEEKSDRDVKKSNKKRNIIALMLVVVFLAGVITAVVKFIPELTDDTLSTPDITISLADYSPEDVSTLTVKSDNTQNSFYSEVEVTEIDGESKRYVTWYLENVSQRLSDSDKIETLVSMAASVKAVRQMGENTGMYGIESPRFVVEVNSRDQAFEAYTITVGNESPDKSGSYAMISGNDTVYLIDSEYTDEYSKSATDYADTTAVKALEETDDISDYFEQGTLTTCDKIVLYNDSFSSPITFKPNDYESTQTFSTYLITSPVKRYANNTNELLDIVANGLVGDGVYVFNPTDEDIKAYGLDKPIATLDVTVGNTVVSLKAAYGPDENYFALIDQDKEAIYKVLNNSLSFATNSMSHYYNQFLTMEMLASLSNITIEIPDNKYEFSVTHYDELEDGKDFDIILNGEELNQTNFQNYYQVFLNLNVIEYTTAEITTAPTYSITMKHNQGDTADTVLKLYKHTDQRYICEVNGDQMGLVAATSVNKLLNYTQMLVAGEDVPNS